MDAVATAAAVRPAKMLKNFMSMDEFELLLEDVKSIKIMISAVDS